jgi:cysteinyl-tRNA synthetase
MVIRFFMMQAHYASILDISDEAVLASEKGYNKLMEAISNIDKLEASNENTWEVKAWIDKCFEAMNDDFNTPILIANLFEGVKQINLIKDGKQQLDREHLKLFKTYFKGFIFEVLGLLDQAQESSSYKLPELVELLIELRNNARANKDFATSDQIRDQLAALGIVLKDGKEGTSFSIQ